MINRIYFSIILVSTMQSLQARIFFPQQTYWRYQALRNMLSDNQHEHTLWAYYTSSSSKKAFGCNGKPGRAQLADIFFNAATFLSSQVVPAITNVTASYAPRFTYKSNGIDIGYHGSWRISNRWSWGVIAEIPIKEVVVHNRQLFTPPEGGSIEFFGNPLSSLFQQQVVTSGNQSYTTYAYRLDFLSHLPYACTGIGLEYPLTVYADPDFLNLPLTISNVDTTDSNNNPVSLLYAPAGTLPSQPYALSQEEAMRLPPLSANGTPTGFYERERIASGVDYTPLSVIPSNQELWWVVPSLMPVAGGQTTVYPARVIRNHVDEVVACYTAQAQNVFNSAGISFASQKMSGFGDITTQLFLSYKDQSWWGLRLRGGVLVPTGRRVRTPQYVFQQPLGNNGHYELQVGAEFLIDVAHCSAIIYCLESHAFARHEYVPTALLGACIKNIGLCSTARVGWDSVSAGILASFFNGDSRGTSDIILGYRVFVTSHDRVRYTHNQAYTIYGTQQPLDNLLMMKKTAQQAHIVQLQARYGFFQGARIDGGVEYTFAGVDVPIICTWNIGLTALF